jgi:hypothetical protein
MKKMATEVMTQVLDTVDETVVTTSKRLDVLVEPSRSSFAKRYPTIFSFIATLGVAMTFLGVEQLLLASSLLQQHPMIILLLGLGLLFLTGSLYTKFK